MQTWWVLVGARSKLRSKVKFFNLCHFHASLSLCANVEKLQKSGTQTIAPLKQTEKKFGSCWFSIFNNCLNIFLKPMHSKYIRVQIKVHAVRFSLLMRLLLAAPTSTHGVFTSFSLSQYCCLHFWRNKFGSMLVQGFLRVKGQAKITNCYFLWVGAIMQSLSGHYLMRQPVPMVFLLPLVYLGAVAYIFVEISLGSCWRRDILEVKGQALFTNCNLLWLCVICNHRVVTSRCAIKYPWCLYFFSLYKCCCLHFRRNKFGLLLAQGYFECQRSRINHKSQLLLAQKVLVAANW